MSHMTTKTKPPVDIFDLLHDYECRGGSIPSGLDAWWENETELQERERQENKEGVATKDNKKGKGAPCTLLCPVCGVGVDVVSDHRCESIS